MTLARLSLLLAFSALTTCAMAGDNLTSSSETTSSNTDAGAQSSAPVLAVESPTSNPDIAPGSRLLFPGALPPDARDRVPSTPSRTRHGLSLGEVHGDVCYTMRSYKVQPSERIREHESVLRGYSECEVASNFQIRSAEAHQKKSHADQPAATLK